MAHVTASKALEQRTGTALLCGLAITGFAANSLLTRLALRPGRIDAATFAALRLASGAALLVVLAQLRKPRADLRRGGWLSAFLLFGYAGAFSFAYLHLGAGTGALVLFGVVQATMIGWGLVRGERPQLGEWCGLLLALLGLVALTLPGARRPDSSSLLLMTLAGVAWGAYSLRGRSSVDPLAATAGNFTRATPFALALGALAWLPGAIRFHVSAAGVGLALASGMVASAGAYTVWYAAVSRITALRAAVLQLAVPILAALGAVILLDEPLTLRLVGSGILVLAGVSVALFSRRQPPPERV